MGEFSYQNELGNEPMWLTQKIEFLKKFNFLKFKQYVKSFS